MEWRRKSAPRYANVKQTEEVTLQDEASGTKTKPRSKGSMRGSYDDRGVYGTARLCELKDAAYIRLDCTVYEGVRRRI